MLKNYARVILRSLSKHKGFAAINILGMSIGIAACLLIFMYVTDEWSYDRYHEHADRIYRITSEQIAADGSSSVQGAMLDPPVGPLLELDFPEVILAARLTPVGPLLSYENRHIDSGNCYWSDPQILDILTIPFAAGDPTNALTRPFSLVLSVSKAEALFGTDAHPADVIGRTVIVNNTESFTVTGIFEDLPHNTHLPIDVLGSLSTMENWFGKELTFWGSPNYFTYVRLNDAKSAEPLAGKLSDFLSRHRDEEWVRLNKLHLQPITDIHLRSEQISNISTGGDIRYVYLLSIIGFFILTIACINYVSLTTARSARRIKEVGLRKTVGAGRAALILQFLGESLLLTALATVLAFFLAWLTLPALNAFTNKNLGLFAYDAGTWILLLLVFILTTGLIAGIYPAIFISATRPLAAIRGQISQSGRRSKLRYTLVVTQFVIAITLIVSTLVVYQQLNFVRNQRLGFTQEQMLILPTIWDLRTDFEPMYAELVQHPDVIDAAQSNPVPSSRLSWTSDISVSLDHRARLTTATVYPVFIDPHFFPTYEVGFIAGINFPDRSVTDSTTGFILNETAAARLGFDNPDEAVDQIMTSGGWRGPIVGVVEDFHFESLHRPIAPMAFYQDPRNNRMVSLRIRAGADIAGLVDFLESKWQEYEPNSPLSYSFLDEKFGAAYASEEQLGRLFAGFSGLAIAITCIGLLGIAAYSVQQRRKEIGVRKVLGATTASVVLLLFKEFAVLLALAFAISVPIGYLGMQRWLTNFAYRIELSWDIFLVAGLLAFVVTTLTLGYQTLSAAIVNPVSSLRSE